MTKKKFIVISSVVATLLISLLIPISGSRNIFASANTPFNESYTRAGVQFSTSTSVVGSLQAQYQTVKGSYYGDAANNTVALNTTNYVGTAIGGQTLMTFSVNSEYSPQNNTVKVNVSGIGGGTLLYAAIEQDS